MTIPETKLRVGLAYRETIVLVLSIKPRQMRSELTKFYKHFRDYVSFPQKNIDHYALMMRKLIKDQVIYYDNNRPNLTVKGKLIVEEIIDTMPHHFKRKWEAYKEMRQ